MKNEPWLPAKYTLADAQAIQSLERGEATPEQQKRALNWIIDNAALTYDFPYRPTGDRDTSLACGRMFVGQQIVKLIKLNLNKIKE